MSRAASAIPHIPALSGVASPVRRNMLLLAAGMAALYGMVELAAAVATLTFQAAGGSRELAGAAPAVFLATAALAALPAGRAMDRLGRARVLRAGFATGICGSLVAAFGAFSTSVVAVVLGFVLVGASTGTVMLSRAAAADMYAPDRRPQAIALVLFGAVFGALLGPAVFIPLVAEGELGDSSLGPAWLGAAGFMVAGLALMTAIRPDPRDIARELGGESEGAAGSPPDAVAKIIRRRGVSAALVAAVTSWSVMVGLMTLTGSALVDHGHDRVAVFPALSAHFVGMFALFPLVGSVIERAGRGRALVGGLLLLGASGLSLAGALHSVPLASLSMFGIGLGWSFAYVAVTAELVEQARPTERGRLLGFADLLAGLAGAGLTVLAGFFLDAAGIGVVAVGAALLSGLAALWIIGRAAQPA